MKKRLLSLLVLLLLLTGYAQSLTSCKKNSDGGAVGDSSSVSPHSHEFSTDWTFDELAHWHTCRVTGCSVISERGGHRYDEGGAQCVTCGRVKKGTDSTISAGSRTSSTWSLFAAEGDTLIQTQRDSMGRVLTRTHYKILQTVGSHTVGSFYKLREEIYTYGDGRLLFSASYSYAEDGALIPIQSEATLSYTTQYRYDANGTLIRADVFNAKGQLTGCYDRFRYGENGKMNALYRYDANLLTQTLTLNEWGEPVRLSDRDGKDCVYAYDDGGNLISLTDGSVSYALTYGENAPLTVTVTDSKTKETLSVTLDLDKELRPIRAVTKTDALELSTKFTYDSAHRLTEAVSTDTKTESAVLSLTYSYRSDGRLLRGNVEEQIDEDTRRATEILCEYSEEGALTRVSRDQTENGEPVAEAFLNATYENGLLTKKQTAAETEDYAYGEDGALIRKTVTTGAGVVTTDFDGSGNPTALTVAITGEPALRYTFDSTDRDYRFLREFAEDDRPAEYHASRMESARETVTREFDSRLRAVKQTSVSADGAQRSVTTYTYDEWDRLRSEELTVTTLDGSGEPTDTERTVTEYGADGVKIKESRYGADDLPITEREYRVGENGPYVYRVTEYGTDGEPTVTLYGEDGTPLPETAVGDLGVS